MGLLDLAGHLVLTLKGSSNKPIDVIVEYLKGNIVKPQPESSEEAPDAEAETQKKIQKETQLQEN